MRELLRALPISVRCMDVSTIQKLVRCALSSTDLDRSPPAVQAILQQLEGATRTSLRTDRIRLNTGVLINIIYWRTGDQPFDDDAPAAFIPGTISIGQVQHVVRLYFKPNTTPLQHVLAFPTSATQCFISAFGAGHLYYSTLCKWKKFLWPHNAFSPKNQTVVELDKRGCQSWKLLEYDVSPETPVSNRALLSNKYAKYVDFDICTAALISGELRKLRVEAQRNVRWETSEGETRFVRSEPRSHRELLWDNREAAGYHPGRPRWLAKAKELAMRHCVVMDTSPSSPTPDELAGV